MLIYLNHLWTVLAVLCYGAATMMLLRDLDRTGGRPARRTGLLLVLGAASHALTLIAAMFGGPYVNLELGTALSAAAWVVMILFLAALVRQPLATLGLVIVPYALVVVLLTAFWNGPPMAMSHSGPSAIAHTLISVAAYGLLALAFCQAVVLLLQEWHLQAKRPGSFFHSLPPLQTMERILFQVIGIGFILLTIALVSGAVFATELFGRAFLFNHHVVLSIVAWLAFGALLLGRATRGMRGRAAATWTIVSFLVLALAYFGSRFVLEVLINRG